MTGRARIRMAIEQVVLGALAVALTWWLNQPIASSTPTSIVCPASVPASLHCWMPPHMQHYMPWITA